MHPGEDPVGELIELQVERGVEIDVERIPRPILEEIMRRLVFTTKWHQDNPDGELFSKEVVAD